MTFSFLLEVIDLERLWFRIVSIQLYTNIKHDDTLTH